MEKTDRIIKRIGLISISLLVVLIIVGVTLFIVNLSPVDSKSEETITFTVESGWSKHKVVEELENKGLIRSAFFAKVLKYPRIFNYF